MELFSTIKTLRISEKDKNHLSNRMNIETKGNEIIKIRGKGQPNTFVQDKRRNTQKNILNQEIRQHSLSKNPKEENPRQLLTSNKMVLESKLNGGSSSKT